jgi:hypothetical protein
MSTNAPHILRKFCYDLDFPIENELDMYRADPVLLNQKLTNILSCLTKFCADNRIKFPTKYKVVMCRRGSKCSGKRCDFAVSHIFKLAAVLMNNRNLMLKNCDLNPCTFGVNCLLAHSGYFKQMLGGGMSRYWVMLPSKDPEPRISPETVVANSSPTRSIEFRPESSPIESTISESRCSAPLERTFAPFAIGIDPVLPLREKTLPLTQPPSPAPQTERKFSYYSEPKTYGVWDLPTIFKS